MKRGGIRSTFVMAVCVAASIVGSEDRGAFAATPSRQVVLDTTAVRFSAPESGGMYTPRFLSGRLLHFLARLECLAREPGALDTPIETRDVKAAVERYVAEELLLRLPVDRAPPPGYLDTVAKSMRLAMDLRAGGQGLFQEAQTRDGISSEEVDELAYRAATAAIYLDRRYRSILSPSEDELRALFRTSSASAGAMAKEEGDAAFQKARDTLYATYVFEKLKGAENTFFLAARPRLNLVYMGPSASS